MRAFIAAFTIVALGGLNGCGPTVYIESTKTMDQVTASDWASYAGWARVVCVVQEDRSLGRCQVIEASPDTAEVREGALQGMLRHGTPDMPASVPPGARVGRKIHVGLK